MESKRFEDTKRAAIVGIVGNIFLAIIKMISGFTFKSQAMIADSINSAGDIFSSAMTSIGNKIASAPSDDDHNLGHGKAEYLFSMFIAISMILVSAELFITDIKNLIHNQSSVTFSYILVASAIITIICKIAMYLYTRVKTKKYNNILLDANLKEHRNDIIAAIFTLISIISAKFGITCIDSITGCGISIWIATGGIRIFIKSYNVLMDKTISEETRKKIIDIVEAHKEVKKINHLNCSPMGVKYMVSISIFVDGDMKTYDSHEIANQIEEEITGLDEVELTIVHVNPI